MKVISEENSESSREKQMQIENFRSEKENKTVKNDPPYAKRHGEYEAKRQ